MRTPFAAHRLGLGETEAECIVLDDDQDLAELWEIDENLVRAELSDAQRAEHHARREAILVRRGEVLAGAGKPSNSDNLSQLKSYSRQAAESLGVNRRTVERDLARGKQIAPEVLADIAGTDLDKGVVLDEVRRAPRETQAAKVAEIRERQEAEKLNRYADKAVARSNAEEAAAIIHVNLSLDQVDALAARLASVTIKDFLIALRRMVA